MPLATMHVCKCTKETLSILTLIFMRTHVTLQLFLRDCEQIEAATGTEEAFLSNDDLGVGVHTQ